jgi:hypothetical protein
VKLPHFENAYIPEAKIVKYLLNLSSENGKAKAKFFLAFGFKPEAWEIFADMLKEHAATHDVTRIDKRPPFGTHYVIEGVLNTPDGRNPSVRVVWIVDENDDTPRLVSAYPM